jgi:hypothetical protein
MRDVQMSHGYVAADTQLRSQALGALEELCASLDTITGNAQWTRDSAFLEPVARILHPVTDPALLSLCLRFFCGMLI